MIKLLVRIFSVSFIFTILVTNRLYAQQPAASFRVIAYYSHNASKIDNYPIEKLTHIIYSFCHLKGDRLNVDDKADSLTIQKLVSLKSRNPKLKVLLSLGGWGGCETCSNVFSTAAARTTFAASVKELANYFKTDGIDLDWEYPTIEGPPGHAYKPEDKDNFTALIKTLRSTLGDKQEISFAAGGFQKYLTDAVDWKSIMPLLDYVNLMNYDMVHGNSTRTGHHTPLYPTAEQKESVEACVQYLLSIGVPPGKMIIGAAFYGRSWINVPGKNNGLYQPGQFQSFLPYDTFDKVISSKKGFSFYYDAKAQASYAYNPATKTFATFDDAKSIAKKTKYAIDNGLGGIMFWELSNDKTRNGYLDVIDAAIKTSRTAGKKN
jgi:chitinase